MSSKCVSARLEVLLEADSPCCHPASDTLMEEKLRHPHTAHTWSHWSHFLCVNIKRTLEYGADSPFHTALESARGRQISGQAQSRGRRTGGESICQPSFQPPHPSPACIRVRGQLPPHLLLRTHLASGADLCLLVCLYEGRQKCVYV